MRTLQFVVCVETIRKMWTDLLKIWLEPDIFQNCKYRKDNAGMDL
jgi:hypothetical protein